MIPIEGIDIHISARGKGFRVERDEENCQDIQHGHLFYQHGRVSSEVVEGLANMEGEDVITNIVHRLLQNIDREREHAALHGKEFVVIPWGDLEEDEP